MIDDYMGVVLFKVRRTRGYGLYKYNSGGHDWTIKEIEELDNKIAILFAPSMTNEDILIVNQKWEHKIVGTERV